MINGIPIHLRGRLWKVCSGAQSYIAQEEFKTYYHTLVFEMPDYPNPCFYQIEIDIKRTFPEDKFFQLPGTVSTLRRVLVAYVKRNPLVGYS